MWRETAVQRRFPALYATTRSAILLVSALIAGACLAREIDVTIFQGEIVSGPEGVRLDFEQPLQRTQKALSIRMAIVGEWEAEPPWDTILMKDGRRIRITACLVASDGRVFDSAVVGRADGLDLGFSPPPPRDASIIAVILKSDLPVLCHEVRWHEYNPI